MPATLDSRGICVSNPMGGSTGRRFAALLLFPALYGGVHLSSRNAPLFNLISAVPIAIFPVSTSACGISIFTYMSDIGNNILGRKIPTKIPFRALGWIIDFRPHPGVSLVCFLFLMPIGFAVWTIMLAYLLSCAAPVLLYPFSKLYILVEAFANLRSLPAGTCVRWSGRTCGRIYDGL